MKRSIEILCILALGAAQTMLAQTESSSSQMNLVSTDGSVAVRPALQPAAVAMKPFSRMALSAGFSPLGVNLTAVTGINDHLNVRFTGNLFNYSTTFTTSGITANAKLNMASAGASLDVYPFHKGFRISPGLLFVNNNRVTAVGNVPSGTAITLNDTDYYSANANPATGATPLTGNGYLNLNTTKPAFTITTGWGNHIQRNGHWSVPFELGVAMIGAPKLNMNLNGWACADKAQTECTNINDPNDPIAVQVQDNLHAQIAKWNKDVEPLKTYPIASVGVAYSFNVRRVR